MIYCNKTLKTIYVIRDPSAKKQAETARVLRLQNIRKTLTGKYSEETLSMLEKLDESVVNNDLVISLVAKILKDNKPGKVFSNHFFSTAIAPYTTTTGMNTAISTAI